MYVVWRRCNMNSENCEKKIPKKFSRLLIVAKFIDEWSVGRQSWISTLSFTANTWQHLIFRISFQFIEKKFVIVLYCVFTCSFRLQNADDAQIKYPLEWLLSSLSMCCAIKVHLIPAELSKRDLGKKCHKIQPFAHMHPFHFVDALCYIRALCLLN